MDCQRVGSLWTQQIRWCFFCTFVIRFLNRDCKSGLIFTQSIGRAKSGGPLSAWVTILGLFKLPVQGWSDLEPNNKYVTITMTWTTSRKFCRAQAGSGFRGSVSEQIGAYAGARAARVARDSWLGLPGLALQVKIDPEDGTVCTYPEHLGPVRPVSIASLGRQGPFVVCPGSNPSVNHIGAEVS